MTSDNRRPSHDVPNTTSKREIARRERLLKLTRRTFPSAIRRAGATAAPKPPPLKQPAVAAAEAADRLWAEAAARARERAKRDAQDRWRLPCRPDNTNQEERP